MCRATTTDFLGTDHTLAHFRTEQWYPRWFDRSLWQGTEYETSAEQEMLERIDRYCRDAIARYEPPDLDQEKLAELERLYRAHEREVLGKNETPPASALG